MIYADASFLVALFVKGDDHWHEAWQWCRGHRGSEILASRLTVFESENTIRGLVLSKQCWEIDLNRTKRRKRSTHPKNRNGLEQKIAKIAKEGG